MSPIAARKKTIIWMIAAIVLAVSSIALGAGLIVSHNSLTDTRNQLTDTQSALSSTQSTLADTENSLSAAKDTLASTEATLADTQTTLDTTAAALTDTQTTLASTEATLAETQGTLGHSCRLKVPARPHSLPQFRIRTDAVGDLCPGLPEDLHIPVCHMDAVGCDGPLSQDAQSVKELGRRLVVFFPEHFQLIIHLAHMKRIRNIIPFRQFIGCL